MDELMLVIDRYGDRWVQRKRRNVYKNVDQDDTDQTLEELLEIAGPLTDYRTGQPVTPCPYTHSHTRHWCGFPQCRAS